MSEHLIPRIARALKHGLGTHTVEDVAGALAAGEMQVFFNDAAICVTEIKQAPRKKFLSIFLVAGELAALKQLQPQVLQFGRNQNCDFVLGSGRIGWQKVATEGWAKRWVVHTFNLNKGAQ